MIPGPAGLPKAGEVLSTPAGPGQLAFDFAAAPARQVITLADGREVTDVAPCETVVLHGREVWVSPSVTGVGGRANP